MKVMETDERDEVSLWMHLSGIHHLHHLHHLYHSCTYITFITSITVACAGGATTIHTPPR
jgi:hypothetical protein